MTSTDPSTHGALDVAGSRTRESTAVGLPVRRELCPQEPQRAIGFVMVEELGGVAVPTLFHDRTKRDRCVETSFGMVDPPRGFAWKAGLDAAVRYSLVSLVGCAQRNGRLPRTVCLSIQAFKVCKCNEIIPMRHTLYCD